ncbi:MAG: hypothetical protein JO042_16625 [Sinobacteraceae bacterium]|nr:hypothetical protein [Nevskiaceae bacterium]
MSPARTGVLRRIVYGTALLTLSTASAWAQDHQLPMQTAEAVNYIKTGLFVVSGDGANTVVRLSGNGMILVDGKRDGHYMELVRRAHSFFHDVPMRLLILTGPEETRTGTNTDFLQAGIPVLAQEQTKEILARHADSQQVLPSMTFDEERSIKLGGVTIQLRHFGAARTNGDTVAYFPDLKVIAVGDLYTSTLPEPDENAGGSLGGWRVALHKILQLDFDTVVPGTGPAVKRADLEALADRIDKLSTDGRSGT